MKNLVLTLAASLTMGGCATCQNHPVACNMAGSFVIASVVLSAGGRDHDVARPHALEVHRSPCTGRGPTCAP